jgi:hypothetical protein
VHRGREGALHEVRRRLEDGLFLDNVEAIRAELGTLILESSGQERFAAWVVEAVLADLMSFWDERPLSPSSYDTAMRP